MWGIYFVGLLAPCPRQHGMLHPKLRLTAQEKAIEKENILLHLFTKICASFMPEGQNLELNALRLRGGMGATRAPIFSHRLCKCAQVLRGAHGGSGPATAGAWGRHQPPHESILTLFSKIIFTRSYARKGIVWD